MKALITGSSSGIGKEITKILDDKGYECLLVSRNLEKLNEVSSSLKNKSQTFSADLSTLEGVKSLIAYCEKENFIPNILVNNAGIGLGEKFVNQSEKEIDSMLFLNMNSLVKLNHFFIPKMQKSEKKSYILNVASTSAYQAMPGFSLYAASKAFVLNFSRALTEELKGTNISVTTLTPGPTESKFIDNAGIEFLKEKAKGLEMSAESVAKAAIDALFKKRKEVIPGFTNLASSKLVRLVPRSLIEKAIMKVYLP